jgi:hypothetical protein
MAGIALAGAVAGIAGCGGVEDSGRSFPIESVGPAQTVTPAVNQTRSELVRVLGEHQLQLSDTQTPVRMAESPLLTTAPRAVYQVVLPKDPDKGYIVVYEFPDAARAAAGAAEQQAYLGSGPGRVQTPQGTVTTIRQVGTTLVLYSWLPAAALDPSAPGVQAALETLGIGFPVAN